ncbi:MAG: hypothetical protein ABIR66_10215 [Saprospiraceae bacterium]
MKHTIFIDQKLIDAFSPGKEYQYSALAFIIGHELAHALEKDKHDTHFLAYDKSKGAAYQNEQNADIQGAFMAYISGYNCLPLISETIETLYDQYDLSAHIKGYPDKSDRIESIGLVKEQVESLIAMFKSANLLLLSEEFGTAAMLYEHIAQYYPGTEVHSNIAVTNILEALNLGKYNYFKYSLPIEINWELRLKKPTLDPGQKEFEPDMIRKRDLLLKKADIVIKQALEYYPTSFTLWNNLICLKLIQGDVTSSKEYIGRAIQKFNLKIEKEQLKMLNGTLALLENNRKEAIKQYRGVQSNWLKQLISKNLNENIQKPVENSCTPQIVRALESGKGVLFQEKKIKIDSLTLLWSREKIKILTHSRTQEFEIVRVNDISKCVPEKYLDRRGTKWSKSLISILNPLDNRQQFYTVR